MGNSSGEIVVEHVCFLIDTFKYMGKKCNFKDLRVVFPTIIKVIIVWIDYSLENSMSKRSLSF